jgi:hypothetical protein
MYALIEYVTDYDKHGQHRTTIKEYDNAESNQPARINTYCGWLCEDFIKRMLPGALLFGFGRATIGEAPEPA